MDGIEYDVDQLIQGFVQSNDIRFESFCTQWNKHKFFYLFHGLRFLEDQKNFMDKCYLVIKSYIFDRRILLEQVGAFYLFYSLYFKQPAKNYCKMRLTLEEWNHLTGFYKTLTQHADCVQARLIHWKLVYSNCFVFVAHSIAFKRIENVKTLVNERLHEKRNFYKSSVFFDVMHLNRSDYGPMTALKLLETGYNEMKEALTANNPAIKKETLPQSQFTSQLKTILAKIDLVVVGQSANINIEDSPSTHSNRINEVRNKISKIRNMKNTLNKPEVAEKELKSVEVVDDGKHIKIRPKIRNMKNTLNEQPEVVAKKKLKSVEVVDDAKHIKIQPKRKKGKRSVEVVDDAKHIKIQPKRKKGKRPAEVVDDAKHIKSQPKRKKSKRPAEVVDDAKHIKSQPKRKKGKRSAEVVDDAKHIKSQPKRKKGKK